MNSKIRKKLSTLMLMAALTAVVLLFVSCGSGAEEGYTEAVEAETEYAGSDPAESESGASTGIGTDGTLKAADDEAAGAGTDKSSDIADTQVDKLEIVYASADALGDIQSVTVDISLKNSDDGGQVEDFTNLYDIKNTEGDEEYTLTDGVLLWENHGEDIQYEGSSDEELPVSVSISYYLDGKAIQPEDLVGQSGEVRIRFDYENLTSETVEIDGEMIETQVPFVACSVLYLPADTFENVEVTNGSAISMDDAQIVMGFAMPGLTESLGLAAYKVTEDVELPEYVEITADVTNFELDFTATIITNGLFDEIDTEDLQDGYDLTEAMTELSDASESLVDGTAELADGMGMMGSYISEYLSGIEALNEGTQALMEGLAAVNEQKSALSEGAVALSDGLKAIDDSLSQVQMSDEGLDLSEALAAITALAVDADKLGELLSSLESVLSEADAIASDAAAYRDSVESCVDAALEALAEIDMDELSEAAESAAVSAAKTQTEAAVREALEGSGLTEEQINTAVNHAVSGIEGNVDLSGVLSAEKEKLAQALESLNTIPELEVTDLNFETDDITALVADMQQQLEILSGYADKLGDATSSSAAAATVLNQLKIAASQLAEGSTSMAAGIESLNTAIEQLYQGAEALNDGTGELVTAGSAIEEGFGSLLDGTGALNDAMSAFDGEGIQELTNLAGDDLKEVLNRIKALKKADEGYDNFSGLPEGKNGNARFIIETAGIE